MLASLDCCIFPRRNVPKSMFVPFCSNYLLTLSYITYIGRCYPIFIHIPHFFKMCIQSYIDVEHKLLHVEEFDTTHAKSSTRIFSRVQTSSLENVAIVWNHPQMTQLHLLSAENHLFPFVLSSVPQILFRKFEFNHGFKPLENTWSKGPRGAVKKCHRRSLEPINLFCHKIRSFRPKNIKRMKWTKIFHF